MPIPQKIERGSSPNLVLRSSLSFAAIRAAAMLWPGAQLNSSPLKVKEISEVIAKLSRT